MGAEVIKIEALDLADMMPEVGVDESQYRRGLGSSYVFINQGKSAISLNLNRAEGRDIARTPIKTADVLMQNYSAGLSAFDLGTEQAMAINPALIYCELIGFGGDNPYSGRPAYDPVFSA